MSAASLRRWSPCLPAILAAGALAPGGVAAAATSIRPDTAPGLGLGTTVTVNGAVYTIANGTLVGANLFESFSSFSLAVGDTARWTYSAGGDGVANVINRVTGGEVSRIEGFLDSRALPKANFYFINPAGIVFGAGAKVAAGGAAHFATASRLAFSDGAAFLATTATGSTLSMAPPTAYGFLGGEGDIAVTGVSSSFVAPESALLMTAADIAVAGSTLRAGRFDLIAVGAAPIDVSIFRPLGAAGLAGTLSITDSSLTGASPATVGPAFNLGAGSITLTGAGLLSQPAVSGPAGAINLDSHGPVTMTSTAGQQTYLRSNALGDPGPTAAGPISLTADSLVMNNANLRSTSVGDIVTAAIDLTVSGDVTLNNSTVQSTVSTGYVGPITIRAASLELNATGVISEPSVSGPGGAIDVEVSGPVTLTGQGANTAFFHSVSRGPAVATPAGGVTVTARSLAITDGDLVSTTRDGVNAGPITVDVSGAVSLLAGGSLASQALAGGTGGAVSITAQSLLIDGGNLNTSAYGTGDAGPVTIDVAGPVVMKDVGYIHSSTNGDPGGRSGNVTLSSASLTLQSNAQIFTTSANGSSGGAITIGRPDGSTRITIDGRHTAVVASNTSAEGGAAGSIRVTASALTVSNGGEIHTDSTAGKAGGITLDFPHGGLLSIEGRQYPGAVTTNSGSTEAGVITIDNPSAIILDGSDVEAQGPAKGAFVTINTPAVVQSSDVDNRFIVTGVVQFDGQYVDIAGSVALSDLSFVDASKVLQGRCAARGAAGGASRLTTRLFGPYSVQPRRAGVGPLAWAKPPPGPCGPQSARQ